jgi:RNA polymerase sigma-70 factor (ECF subfamily)
MAAKGLGAASAGDGDDLQRLLERHRSGDPAARCLLIEWADRWMRSRVRARFRQYGGVERWEQWGDAHNEFLTRLDRALSGCRPENPQHFLRLVNLRLRHLLEEWRRHYQGRHGIGANHKTSPDGFAGGGAPPGTPLGRNSGATDPADKAVRGEEIARLREAIRRLPMDQREALELHDLRQFTHEKVAEILGRSVITVKRLVAEARSNLGRDLGEG